MRESAFHRLSLPDELTAPQGIESRASPLRFSNGSFAHNRLDDVLLGGELGGTNLRRSRRSFTLFWWAFNALIASELVVSPGLLPD